MIKTARLILREFTEDDLSALGEILADEDVNHYLPWFPLKTPEEVQHFYQNRILTRYEMREGYYFAVCLQTDNKPVGYISVSGSEEHDFGYGLVKPLWGQGIITEACQEVIEFLREQDYKFITATHDVKNIASGKVMEKLGMTYQYSYVEQWQPKNIEVTFRMYQLNFDVENNFVYQAYWDKYPNHFVEEG